MKETVMTAAPPAIATCVKSPGATGDAAKGDCVFKLMVIRGIEVKGGESVLAVWKIVKYVMGDQSISSVSDDVLRVRGTSRIFRSFAGTTYCWKAYRRCSTRY
jgi:hypothetical protein